MSYFDKYTRLTKLPIFFPDKPMYHYTNRQGLQGILESQQIWLTERQYLNDSSEIMHAFNVIKNSILEIAQDKNLWEELFSFFCKNYIEKTEHYIFSFSSKSNYLYAWRCYADDGAGYCLKFSKNFFENKEENNLDQPMFVFLKNFYSNSMSILDIKIQDIVSLVEEDIKKNECHKPEIFIHFIGAILHLLPVIKHPAYKEEDEYRIVSSAHDDKQSQIFYICSNGVKKQYYSFNLEYVEEIWVGPRLDFKQAKSDIENLLQELRKKGHRVDHIQIRPSEIPYKPLKVSLRN